MLCTPGSECTLEELQKLPEASLNIVTNAELGLPLAEYLQKKYGTPYVLPACLTVCRERCAGCSR